MALNTSPSFGRSMTGSGSMLSNQVAGQRAAKRRATPMGGSVRKSTMGGPPMRPNPPTSRTFSSSAAGIGPSPFRSFGYDGAAAMGNLGNPKSMSMGYNPGGGMPPPFPMSPTRTQALGLMDAGPQGPQMDGMVAATAPQMDMNMPSSDTDDMAARLREKMGGNTGFTGGMGNRRPGMWSAY